MARSVWAAGAAAVFGVFLAASPAAAVPFYWTDWQTAGTGGGFTGNGTITTPTATVGVSYHNDKGIGFYYTGAAGEVDFWAQGHFGSGGRNPATSPYTSTVVDNIPTGTDMIALQFAGSQTLTFTETIANPVFAFNSLNFNGYAFLNQDFEILSVSGVDGNDWGYWGSGGVTKVVKDLGGGNFEYQLNASTVAGGIDVTEPHGVIRFLGAFDTLTWTSSSNEYWNGFTVGVQGTAKEVFPEDPPPTTPVPEPASVVLLGAGVVAVATRLRRRA